MSSEPSLDEPSLTVLAEELIGTPYVPLRFLARGGMGSLVEVEHTNLKRTLVMKVLRESGRPDLEDRLRLEAHALARLSHPNVLGIVDFRRTPKGRPYFVAERLHGRTLREHLNLRGQLPATEAADLAIQALSGLSAAHELGIVHRDVKLENLFVCDTKNERPLLKVLDFGIAKIVETEPGRGLAIAPPLVPTEEGSLMGTPSFMSPEQILSRKVDHRADLYGMGVVLFRLLTGRHPFPSDSALDYARAHATLPPPPPSRFVAVPAGLEAVVMKALEKQAAHRFASALDMIRALEPYATPTIAASPPPRVHASEDTPTVVALPPSLANEDSDALPTNPIRKPATPPPPAIASIPAFAPVAPPKPAAPPAAPAETPRMAPPPKAEPKRTLNGTIITGESIVPKELLLHPDGDETATRFAPSLDPTPPAAPRRSTRPPRALELGRLSAAVSRDEPTLLGKRRKMDRRLWTTSLLLLAIVLGVAAYAAYLVARAI